MSAFLKTYTLGCKVNQYETELVREGLSRAGYQDAEPEQPADVCLINTCTVTAEGDAKSRQVIRRLVRQNPDSRVVVMGCYATREPDTLAAIPGVAEVVTDKREIPDLLGRFGVVDVPDGLSRFGNRHRAYVKVQDGCLLRCSYCIIPKVRPDMYSRPLDSIVSEVRRLVKSGHREIVLTGIHLGHYGVDFNRLKPREDWIRLATLLRRLMAIDSDFRVRLSSIEATEVTRELMSVMQEFPQRICPHLHVCLQSGSDRILARMNRRWGAKRFVDRCLMLRDRLDHPALTTDVIVGFPGETDDDFHQTCDVVDRCGFSKVHIFPFSARKGTPAAEMDGQLSKQVKSQRVRALEQLETQLRERYFGSLIDRALQVMVEQQTDGQCAGTACRYAPVSFEAAAAGLGDLVTVRADRLADGIVIGQV